MLFNTAWAAPATKVGVNTSAWEALWGASLVVQITLLLLVGLSVISWAIILSKRKQFSQISKANEKFLAVFWKAPSLDAIFDKIKDHEDSPIARVFRAGFLELQRLADVAFASDKNSPQEASPQLSGIDNLSRALRKAMDTEILLLENRLIFLATTSSNGPFVGLFGTVWGIMGAFHKIGQTGAASLAVVAPGISEALIATAIGLAAAIPAGAAYNFFIN
ncbi:MAG: MotA/TolQ/ExbB proton channel family protein, partial [Bdellovibrionia bacterium]